MENKHLLGIYAIVNQVTLRPKETSGDLVSTFYRVSTFYSSALNRLKNENGTNEQT